MEELIRKKKNVDFSVYENGKSNLGSCQSLLDPILIPIISMTLKIKFLNLQIRSRLIKTMNFLIFFAKIFK